MEELKVLLLNAGVPEGEYSIGGYCECSIGIVPNAAAWMVFHGERGNKYDLRFWKSVAEVVKDVCERVGVVGKNLTI